MSGGPAAKPVPAQVHVACRALDDAEKSFTDQPESQGTRDLAYVAPRQAQMAEINAQAEEAKKHAQTVERIISEAEAKTGDQSCVRLGISWPRHNCSRRKYCRN